MVYILTLLALLCAYFNLLVMFGVKLTLMPLTTAPADVLQMTAASAEPRAPLSFPGQETEVPKADDTRCSACLMALHRLKFHTPVFFEKPFMGLLGSCKIVNQEKVTEVFYSVFVGTVMLS